MCKALAVMVGVIGFFLIAGSAGLSDCGGEIHNVANIVGLVLMLLSAVWLRFLLNLERKRYMKSLKYYRAREKIKKKSAPGGNP